VTLRGNEEASSGTMQSLELEALSFQNPGTTKLKQISQTANDWDHETIKQSIHL
jgi:hypothetical protein